MKPLPQVCDGTTRNQCRSLAHCQTNVLVDFVQCGIVDKRPHFNIGIGQRIAKASCAHSSTDTVDELISDGSLHIDAFSTVAHLSGIDDSRTANCVYRKVYIGISKHDCWSFTTELQVEFGQVIRGG
ncbi:hypothetical protein D3C85_1321380 [compost metagenome]